MTTLTEIVVSMVPEVVRLFHHVLGHPGQTRMRDTLQARYHNHRLRSEIDKLVCQDHQRHKLTGKGYGLLPEREIKVEFLTHACLFSR